MFYSTDVRHERFWQVGIARNAVFFHSFVASKVRKGRSEKRGGAKDRLPKMSTKFAPRLRAGAIRKSKSLKTGGVGALLEVDVCKICTTSARESDSEVNVVKNRRCRTVLEVDMCKMCTTSARESDSEVKIVKNWRCRSTFGSCARQNLHHACARAIWKPKSLKRGRFGALLEVELRKICTTPARESDLEVKSENR